LAAVTLGTSKFLIANGVRHAKTRIQFGRPICEFGLIKQKIAEMVVKTYVNESMIYRTACLLDMALEGIDPSKEDAGRKTGEVLRKYAIECSINKVFGSEALDYIADECVQIMGGYGYIRDNPVESIYRDSRINRIWEGTNEINRLVIVDLLIKAAKKGDLSFFDAVKKVTEEVPSLKPGMGASEGVLEEERKLVTVTKKIALMTSGAVSMKYTDNLENEQELVALIADIIIEIFAMESALLRALKKLKKDGEEQSAIHVAATQVYINDAFASVGMMAKQIFAAVFEEEELKIQLTALKKLTRHTPVNAISLRREIADSIIPVSRYHLTKI
jgi:alkylation response protein AidB-like acyl-CoA dehydrogenase